MLLDVLQLSTIERAYLATQSDGTKKLVLNTIPQQQIPCLSDFQNTQGER